MLSSIKGTETVQIGHHLMAIYENIDDEINEAFEFLSEGLRRNEAVMILTEDAGKDKLLKRIKENESALGGNIEELEKRGNVTIESTSSWYFPDGVNLNPDRIIATFTAMVDLAINNGKKAIRIFGDMSAFFKAGFTMDLLNYESKLGKKFDLPLFGVCAFLAENINSLNPKQFEELQEYHNAVWK
ncbi:MAG TPA: MEDS domain-containing protein [Nitrososphaeraceae archaeon]|nr:MEDS domain-containing protein [Nitrososphaeraceae archaeon]